jgi:hypothetical protein
LDGWKAIGLDRIKLANHTKINYLLIMTAATILAKALISHGAIAAGTIVEFRVERGRNLVLAYGFTWAANPILHLEEGRLAGPHANRWELVEA